MISTDLINGKTKSNVRARSVHKVIKFYKSCMDVNRIETEGQRNLFKKIKSLGGLVSFVITNTLMILISLGYFYICNILFIF